MKKKEKANLILFPNETDRSMMEEGHFDLMTTPKGQIGRPNKTLGHRAPRLVGHKVSKWVIYSRIEMGNEWQHIGIPAEIDTFLLISQDTQINRSSL